MVFFFHLPFLFHFGHSKKLMVYRKDSIFLGKYVQTLISDSDTVAHIQDTTKQCDHKKYHIKLIVYCICYKLKCTSYAFCPWTGFNLLLNLHLVQRSFFLCFVFFIPILCLFYRFPVGYIQRQKYKERTR